MHLVRGRAIPALIGFLAGAVSASVFAESEPDGPNGSEQRITLELVMGLDDFPIANEKISVRPVGSRGGRAPDVLSDAKGRFEVPPALVTDRWPAWRVTVAGFVPAKIDLAAPLTESDQVQSRLKLERAVSGGGRILDSDGRPVEGAQVAVLFDEPPVEAWFLPGSLHVEITDDDGRWQCQHLPAGNGPARLLVVHPGFAPLSASASSAPGAASFRFEDLKEERSFLFLQRGKHLRGQVLDAENQPVEGARILSSHYPVWTPADGSFELPVAAGAGLKLLIRGPHHESQMRLGGPDDEAGNLRIILPTRKQRLLVVRDKASQPVADALVRLVSESEAGVEIQRTGSNGEIEIGGGELKISVFKPGFQLVENLQVSADISPVRVTLEHLLELSAPVIDVETSKPVSECTVVPGIVADGGTQWLNDRKVVVRDGRLRVRFQPDAQMIRLAIEAGDYYQHVTSPVAPAKWDSTTPIRLQRRKTISGGVQRPDGSLGVGARVAAVPQGGKLVLGNAGSLDVPPAWFVEADSDGNFALSAPEPAAFLVASDPVNGLALLAVSNASAPAELTLRAWGEVEGVVMANGHPAPDQLVALATESRAPIGLAANTFVRRSDSKGHFHFTFVPPVAMRIGKYDSGLSHSEPVKVVPGGRMTVNFPAKGWRVHGMAVWKGSALDWSGGSHLAIVRSLPANKGEDSTVYRMTLRPDGEFSVDDIPAGNFELVIHFHEPSADGSGRLDDKYQVTTNLTLSVLPGGSELSTHEMGILELQPGPPPATATGDQP